jgi:PTS system beta-glucosides-specific IIC component
MMVVTNQDSYTVAVDESNETLDNQSVMNIAKLGV